jgi:hypothetical protein
MITPIAGDPWPRRADLLLPKPTELWPPGIDFMKLNFDQKLFGQICVLKFVTNFH